METMLLAQVVEIVDLPCREACLRFPVEAGACRLSRMARSWTGGKVRCIVLSRARPATDYVNLSAGCLGFVSQFESTTGTPRFCHVSDLHKTIEVTLNSGPTASIILKRSWPLTANFNPSRRHGDDGGGGGGAGRYDIGGVNVQYVLRWKKKGGPKSIVGAEPYAQASSVELMGFSMMVEPFSAIGNGSCFHIAFCTTMHLLLKNVNMDVLSQYLTFAEATNASLIAAIGKEIVQFQLSIDEDVKGLIFAHPFREVLEQHFNSNAGRFYEHFKDKKTEDYGGETNNSSTAKRPTMKRWCQFILSHNVYWDNVLSIILGDMFPSLSILLLYSEQPLIGGTGTLHYFDGIANRELSPKDEKAEKMRIVLHVINRSLGRLRHSHKLRPRTAESSNFTHYEPVQLDVDLQFHFPQMDTEMRHKLIRK
jgi:hypothetical protein